MKFAHLLAATSVMISSLGIGTAAEAKNHRPTYGHHDNGNHYGWRNGRGRQHCRTEWHHHRKVRVCR